MREHQRIVDMLEGERDELKRRVGEGEKEEEGNMRELELKRRIEELEDRIVSLSKDQKRDWGWDDGDEMMSMTDDSPAIFGVPNHQPHPANSKPNHNNSVKYAVS